MTTLHYVLSGPTDAPVVVLSNSLGTTLDMWAPQVDALSDAFRVLRYDTRGHGASEVPDPPYTIDELGGDVLALLDSLGIERAHYIGLSLGGLTGQWLAVHAPSRIDKLVLSNTAARLGTTEGWRARAALARSKGLDAIASGSPARWVTPEFAAAQPAAVEALIARLRTLSPKGYAACCEALANTDLRDCIDRIGCPTLVIAGEYDPVTTVSDAQFIVEHIRDAQHVMLPASHLSNVESAQAFNQAVLRFLSH